MGMYPGQYKVDNIKIDGIDIMGIFVSLEIFENIFIPLVCGHIIFADTDGAGFVDTNEIEFNEDFEFTITNSQEEQINFMGVLNGVASEQTSGTKKMYKVDFVSTEMRNNDQMFISERFTQVTPQDVISDMIQRIEGTIEATGDAGKQMEFVAGRWKPLHVLKHVLKHGVTNNATASNQDKEQEEVSKGTSGFLCWQSIGEGQNKYRMCSVDDLISGVYEKHGPFENKMMMRGSNTQDDMSSVLEYSFDEMGDIQTKMKSGAFRCINVSFDMDTGLYKEYEYDASQERGLMSEKQKKIVTKPTRVLFVPYTNDKFTKSCAKEADNTGDQSRESIAQSNARQNTFNDQTGSVTLYSHFGIHAGDIIDLKINKVISGESKGTSEDEKHSGKYAVKQVGHYFMSDGKAFTKVTTIRSTTQTDTFKAEAA
jgi:hypothetical protein